MKNVLFITQNDFSVCDVFLFSVNIKLRKRGKKKKFCFQVLALKYQR